MRSNQIKWDTINTKRRSSSGSQSVAAKAIDAIHCKTCSLTLGPSWTGTANTETLSFFMEHCKRSTV